MSINTPQLDPAIMGGPMRLSDLVGGYWCITDPMMDEIQAIYDAHMRGEKIDIKGVEARIGRPLNNQRADYTVQDGVAIIPMSGVIGPKANLMMEISGGTSAQVLRNQILAAKEDPKVKAAILYADSPGGNVLGIAEGAAAWRDFAAAKPAITYSDGTLASAAYWWGSAAAKVYISGPMVNVGSIGVRTEHVDTSMRDAASGVKRTIIKAGAYKAVGDGPMDPQSFEYRQSQVDYLYSLFVDTVAQHRGTTAERVLADMADGRVFIGQQAIDAGLVDGFASLENLVAQLADNPQSVAPLRHLKAGSQPAHPMRAIYLPSATAAAGAAAAVAQTDEPVPPVATATDDPQGHDMDIKTVADLEKAFPDLTASLKTNSFEAGKAEGIAAGQAAEVERIKGVRAQALPGHEALIEQLAYDGKTSPAEAAMAINAAQREAFKAAAAAHFADAPNPAKGDPRAAAQAEPTKRTPNVQSAYAGLNKQPTATA